MSIDTASLAFKEMSQKWDTVAALMGGTETMRMAPGLLPQEPEEDTHQYAARLAESFLEPGYLKAVLRAVSLPFSQMVTVTDSENDIIDAMKKDIDRQGSQITDFARNVMRDAVAYGKTHILTDFTALPVKRDEETGEEIPRSVAEEREMNQTPYFTHIPAQALIGWKQHVVRGETHLYEIRYTGSKVVFDPEDPFDYEGQEVKTVTRINTLDKVWEVWTDANGWTVETNGDFTQDKIPLTIIYTNKTGFMTAEPPMWVLAEANVEHWQDYSDQKSIVKFARTGMHHFAGFKKGELGSKIVMGGNNYVTSTDSSAKVSVIEHSGSAVSIGQEQLDKIKERMDKLGAEPLHERSGSMVATGVAINENRANSDLTAWIQVVEVGLNEAYRFAAAWLKTELPDDFKVSIFKDFTVPATAQDGNILISIRPELDKKTFLEECQRRNILDRNLDLDAIIEAAKAETPEPLPPVGGQGEPPTEV